MLIILLSDFLFTILGSIDDWDDWVLRTVNNCNCQGILNTESIKYLLNKWDGKMVLLHHCVNIISCWLSCHSEHQLKSSNPDQGTNKTSSMKPFFVQKKINTINKWTQHDIKIRLVLKWTLGTSVKIISFLIEST